MSFSTKYIKYCEKDKLTGSQGPHGVQGPPGQLDLLGHVAQDQLAYIIVLFKELKVNPGHMAHKVMMGDKE